MNNEKMKDSKEPEKSTSKNQDKVEKLMEESSKALDKEGAVKIVEGETKEKNAKKK